MTARDTPGEREHGGPAFPVHDVVRHAPYTGGMTLQDYFAAHAPAAPAWWWESYKGIWKDELDKAAEHEAQWRFVYADAMLKQRSQP